MRCRLTIVGLLAGGAQAFAPAPIKWSAVSGRNFVVAPRGTGQMELPSKLTIRDARGAKSRNEIPSFTAKPDNTISWESPQGHLCIEAIGDKNGVAVGVNRCDGGKNQLWNFMPSGRGSHIQLKDTNQCIDVNVYKKDGFNRGLDGAPMELRECGDKKTESWTFEAPFLLPTTETQTFAQAFYPRSLMTYFISLAAVGALSLGAWIWRRQDSARMVAASPGGMSLDVEVGEAGPSMASMSRTGDVQMMAKWSPTWKQPGFYTAKPTKVAEQNFLEFEPYYDQSTMPNNTYKPKAPFTGTIRSVEKIVGPNATGETYDIIIDHEGKMPYIEGQSYGVIAPGIDPKTGKPAKVRLYSIASSRYGDDMQGVSTTLCVRRATYWCPELGAEDPAKKGVCSNFLCDAKAGDAVVMTGPTGKALLLPEQSPETDIIMVATGTGIAPFRSFLKRMFVEKTPYGKDFTGLAWLFLGVANTDSLLYDEDWKKIQKEDPDRFRYDVALSREQTNKAGGKMYIQDKVEEYADEIFDRLDKGAHMYFCGLRGMMPGIQDMLKRVAEGKGLDYEAFIKDLKKKGQWHVEVY